MLFAQKNSDIKDQHFSNLIQANSAITGTEGQRIIEQLDKNDIIPEPAPAQPTANLRHLPRDLQTQYGQLITDYDGLYATSKSERGHFTGFAVVAKIRHDPKINCRQPPRHKHLPASCLKDLRDYKNSGLFEDSTGRADTHAANITLVLKQHGRELNDKSKATKNQIKHKMKQQVQDNSTTPDQDTAPSFRMTIDMRNVNRCSENETSAHLPSIQAIESSFHNSIVSTLDVKNCYPSIELDKDSRSYFNFWMLSDLWQHQSLAQGWAPSLAATQRALAFTFRDQVLEDFKKLKGLTDADLPHKHYFSFLINFVDDISVFSNKDLPNAHKIHLNCLEATFYALARGGWKFSLPKCTFADNSLLFLGLSWDLSQKASLVPSARLNSILQFRVPRSLPELASRLSQVAYFNSYILHMKRVSLPLYNIIKTGKFKWTKLEAESYTNLLFLFALQLKNHIHNPTKPLILYADTSQLETGLSAFQFDTDELSL